MLKKNWGAGLLGAALLGVASLLSGSVQAQNQEVRFIVPMAPGGSVDTLARMMARALSEKTGQSIVVENRPGAGGILAASYVARAEPDGHTVFVADTGQLSVNPWLYKKLPYNFKKGFTPITEAVSTPLFLTVNPVVPANSVQELIAYLKKKPSLAFGSPGIGSVHHLGMEIFAKEAGVKILHVPYKGAAPSMGALVAGDVAMALVAWPSLKGFSQNGKIKILAVATAERTPINPDVPTIAESGVKGFSATPTVGFLLPPGAPNAIVDKLNRNMVEVLKNPDFRKKLLAMGLVPIANSPADYQHDIDSESAKYRKLIQTDHITVE